MRVAVYCIVRDRLEITRKSLKALRKMAGCDIDLYVADNGSRASTTDFLRGEKAAGNFKYLKLNRENVGQNLAANHLIDKILEDPAEYEWILRWDNDAIPRTRRFLKKLVRRSARFLQAGAVCVTSPNITKLNHPPPAIGAGEELGFPYYAVEILGGICRLHPALMFKSWYKDDPPFRFSRFAPLGFGEASEMAQHCEAAGVQMLRMKDLDVEHAGGEDGQKRDMPQEFSWERREVGRHVSYGL
jgi:hypothetical protein